jgi:hypothetical protein
MNPNRYDTPMAKVAEIAQTLQGGAASQTTLKEHGDTLQRQLGNNQPFQEGPVYQELQRDIESIEAYVVSMAKSALLQITDWDRSLLAMESELGEISGLVQRAHSEAAATLSASILCKGSLSDAAPSPDQIQPPAPVFFPPYQFDINMHVLTNVGHQVADLQPGKKPGPLITKIEPGSPAANFWSLRNDYFCPGVSVPVMSLSSSDEITSFSEFYHIDPLPEDVRSFRNAQSKH